MSDGQRHILLGRGGSVVRTIAFLSTGRLPQANPILARAEIRTKIPTGLMHESYDGVGKVLWRGLVVRKIERRFDQLQFHQGRASVRQTDQIHVRVECGNVQHAHDAAGGRHQIICRPHAANDAAVFLLHPKITRLGRLQDAVAVLAAEIEQRVLALADDTLDKWLGYQFAMRKRGDAAVYATPVAWASRRNVSSAFAPTTGFTTIRRESNSANRRDSVSESRRFNQRVGTM